MLQATLRIVDAEGLEAVSMRRVAEALGVEAMSLYHHVPNKAALLDGLFECVLAELPSLRPARTWRAELTQRARAFRAVLCAHPNALPLFAARPAVTPASLAHVEGVLEVLRSAGFAIHDAISVLHVMSAFVIGHTSTTRAPRPAEEVRPAYGQLEASRFPRVLEAAAQLASHDSEQEFELGLQALLGGLALRLEGRTHGT